MTKVWSSVPSSVEYASRWRGAIAAAIIGATGITREQRGSKVSRFMS
jgi:hypothetical protein